MATYPGAIVSLTNPTAADSMLTVNHAEQHSLANDEVEAIETELGTNPKGGAASVGARIAATETVANAAVPKITTVNSKALSGNISLSASDVGAPSGSGTCSGTNTGDQTLPTEATITTTDVTTNNATASKHGWLPKLENTGTKYLKDDGTWATPAGGASVTRGTFVNADLTTGVLTVTHSKGLSAPYSLVVQVFNNSAQMIIPDAVTGLTNTFTIDLTSYGTLTGTWGYSYLA